MLHWEQCPSAYLPLHSFHSPYLSSSMLSQSYISQMAWIRDTCHAYNHLFWFLRMNLLLVGPKCLKKPWTRKKHERQSIARFSWYHFLLNRTSVSMAAVFDTVWCSVGFCCGCAVGGVCFLISDFERLKACFIFGFLETQYCDDLCLMKEHAINLDILTENLSVNMSNINHSQPLVSIIRRRHAC